MTLLIRNLTRCCLLSATLLGAAVTSPLAAQEGVEGRWTPRVGGELASQYLWRGLRLSDGPSLQPEFALTRGGFEVGVWSTWGLTGDYHEVDTYLSWTWDLPAGGLTLTATDYFYPKEDAGFFNFDGVVDGEATGGHTVELGAVFSPVAVPLSFELGWNAYNDPDKALFGGVGAEVPLPHFDVGAEVSMLLKDSPTYYGGAAGDLLEYRISVSRTLPLGAFEPYVSASVVRSALMDKTYLVFALGF